MVQYAAPSSLRPHHRQIQDAFRVGFACAHVVQNKPFNALSLCECRILYCGNQVPHQNDIFSPRFGIHFKRLADTTSRLYQSHTGYIDLSTQNSSIRCRDRQLYTPSASCTHTSVSWPAIGRCGVESLGPKLAGLVHFGERCTQLWPTHRSYIHS